jgi:hypothetical protein
MMRSLLSRRSQRIEEFVGGHDRAYVSAGNLGDRAVDNAELGTKLALRAGGIHLPETMFPEATTDRQQRIVFHDGCAVLRALGEAGALKVS